MKKNTPISLIGLSLCSILFSALLSACGQKGPLYLPEKKSQVEVIKAPVPEQTSSTNNKK